MLKGKEFGAAIARAIRLKIDSGAAKSKAEIARHFGMQPPSLSDWAKKGSVSKDKLPELWRYFSDVAGPEHWGMSPSEWPVGLSRESKEEGAPVIALHPDDRLPDGVIQIPVYKVLFSAGNGHTVSYEQVEETEPVTYRLSFFQRLGINPEKTKRFKVDGDSMEPFLYSGDSVLVNLAENDPTRIINGKVYAIRYVDKLRIKRLFRKLDGTIVLRSDNPNHPDEDVPVDVAEEHITIIGRVRDKSGTGGL